MRDYEFGEHLFELRREKGLTQGYIASMLGVSDRAVSKWENGLAKPTVFNLNRLADILGITLDELMNTNKKDTVSQITKIVITGGPCSGKTTSLNRIKKHFESLGYKVLIVPAVGTNMIACGLKPIEAIDYNEYEKLILSSQIALEETFESAVNNLSSEKILIICDRGALDVKAYSTEKDFKLICNDLDVNENELKQEYDAVFHLKTVAKGHEEEYKQVEELRIADIEDAIILDDKTISAWTGHPNLRIIDSYPFIEDKIKKLIKEISTFLNEDDGNYIEKKYLINKPDIDYLDKLKYCKKVHIVQHYLLDSTAKKEVKIVLRRENGNNLYYKVVKGSNGKFSTSISADEYINLLETADPNRASISKDRYNFIFDSKYYKIDIFPFWKDRAILEIDLLSREEKVKMPKFVEVLEDVSDNINYKNSELAKLEHENNQ